MATVKNILNILIIQDFKSKHAAEQLSLKIFHINM